MSAYETVIGLEVHAQLITRTKAFCSCATSFGDAPNMHTCPVCLGLPGALPVLNEEAVRMAAGAAIALGCELQRSSVFARKNYFYPDLPKGYQISQYDKPLAMHGAIDLETEAGARHARILRVHMEEDAGKTVHGQGSDSIVDLNRAGTPLIEIVGEPDLRSGAEAAEYLKRVREILMFISVNDGNLEQGSFRCDANVSVRKVGDPKLGTRTELKNINSFRFVADAIDVEARRQVRLLEGGQAVRQETRGYNADKRETYLLRVKDNESGYRYFPEPDLPPLVLEDELVREVRDALPETPSARRSRYVKDLALTPQAAQVLTGHPEIAAFFEGTVRLLGNNPSAVRAANFIQSEVLRDVKTNGLTAEIPISPKQIADLLRAVEAGTISGKQAKEVYARMRGNKLLPDAIIRDQKITVVSDEGALTALASKLVAGNPKQASSYRAGKTNLLGYFVGLMMKETRGSADPQAVNRVLKEMLDSAAPTTQGRDKPKDAAPPVAEPREQREQRDEAVYRVPDEPAPPTPLVVGAIERVPPRDPPHTPRSSASADGSNASTLARVPPTPRPAEGANRFGFVSPRTGAYTTLEEEASPLAESVVPPAPASGPPVREHTLTSAAFLASLRAAAPGDGLSEVLARIDVRVGSILFAAHVPSSDSVIDLAIEVGEASPVRVLQSLGKSFTPESLVGMRILVARAAMALESEAELMPPSAGPLPSRPAVEAVILCGRQGASPSSPGAHEGLTLVTVPHDLPIGTRVGACSLPRPNPSEPPA